MEVDINMATQAVEELLSKVGMTAAAEKVKRMRTARSKMAVAYEHYRYVKPEKLQAFQAKLAQQSKRLEFIPLEKYEKVPPENVLKDLEKAIEVGCFDKFEVAEIRRVEDPLLFGVINGCHDMFFISQWDEDVKISDILKENEG